MALNTDRTRRHLFSTALIDFFLNICIKRIALLEMSRERLKATRKNRQLNTGGSAHLKQRHRKNVGIQIGCPINISFPAGSTEQNITIDNTKKIMSFHYCTCNLINRLIIALRGYNNPIQYRKISPYLKYTKSLWTSRAVGVINYHCSS